MAGLSMFGSILTKIGDIIAGFFAIIPQALYFLYASIASLLDMFQYVHINFLNFLHLYCLLLR